MTTHYNGQDRRIKYPHLRSEINKMSGVKGTVFAGLVRGLPPEQLQDADDRFAALVKKQTFTVRVAGSDKLEDWDLTFRITNALETAGITTVSQLREIVAAHPTDWLTQLATQHRVGLRPKSKRILQSFVEQHVANQPK